MGSLVKLQPSPLLQNHTFHVRAGVDSVRPRQHPVLGFPPRVLDDPIEVRAERNTEKCKKNS